MVTEQQQPLEIGSRLRLRSLETAAATAHMTRVEDMTDQWVAVQRPTVNYKPVRLFPGTDVELSVTRTEPPGLAGKYRARSVVLGEVGRDLPLLRLQLPTEWERAQLREFFRVPATRPVRVRSVPATDDDEWIEGRTRDLSGGGCQVVLPVMLERGQSIELELELPDGVYRVRGTVRRGTQDVLAPEFSAVIGVQFSGIVEKQREELIRYAFERQIELRKRGMT